MIQFAVFVVLLSAASMATCDKRLEEYFQFPDQAANQDLLRTLADDTLLGASDLSVEFKKRSGENELFAQLASLSDVNDATCSDRMTQSFINIFGLINQSVDDGENREFAYKYSAYLKQHGREKFAKCAAKTAEEFAKVQIDSATESALDKLVGGALSDDQKLFKLAQSFEGDASQVTAECARVQGPLKHIFDVYNLARVLGKSGAKLSGPEVPVKFLKLNEYNRICLQEMVA